jgi:hypothetical protein
MNQIETSPLKSMSLRTAARRASPTRACELCGEVSERPFQITQEERVRVFDSFECAVAALAVLCHGCGALVMGKGLVLGSRPFCSRDCLPVR